MTNPQTKSDIGYGQTRSMESFVTSMPHMAFEFDFEGNVTYCNRSASNIFGYDRNDMERGLCVFDLIAPEQKQKFEEIRAGIMSGAKLQRAEFTALTRDGKAFPLKLTAFPALKDGAVAGIRAIVRNITVRKENKRKYAFKIRQLEVLRRIAKLRTVDDKLLAVRIQMMVDMIPAAFQYPGVACARISTGKGEYRTSNFKVTPWGIKSDIGTREGNSRIEVYYLEQKPDCDVGPFLQDEQYVLDDIAERLEVILRRYWAREKISSLQSAVDNATDGIAITDSSRHVTYANKAMAEMLDYTVAEMVGMAVKDMFYIDSEEDLNQLKANRITVEQEGFIEREANLKRKDGASHPVYLTNTRVSIDGKDERYLITVVKDLSRQKQFQEAIRQSRETMERVFECATESITATDLDGFITEVNQSTVEMHGYEDRQQLIGMHAMDLIAPEDRKKAVTNMLLTATYGSVKNVEYILLKKDGTRFPAELSAGVLKDAGGEPIGFVATTRDISLQKHYRQTMQDTIQMVIKAQEEERKRIARDLHDDTIQSLMALLLDVDGITRMHDRLPDISLDHFSTLRKKISDIVDEVRRFTHELRPAVIDRFGLISAVEMLVNAMEQESDIETRFELIGDQRRLSSDKELILFRIVQEALNNVKRHSQATQCTVRIEFTKKTVKLIIKDNGLGFTVPEIIGDLVHTGKLGVVGMYERAQLIEANFSLESAGGRGTTVKVKAKD